jgi:phospholipid transport system substrate-binding protein
VRGVRRRLASLAVVLLATTAGAGPARAGQPTEVLRQSTEQIRQILEDPTRSLPDKRLAVRRVAEQIFDVTEAARRALGPHWLRRTPAEREEFVRLFAELLEYTYVSRIDQYAGERVHYTGESVEGDHAAVRGRIVTPQGVEVPVEARLHRRGDRWLVYDLHVENVSLVGNYRAQFDRIVRTASWEELVRRLRTRVEQLKRPPEEARPVRS